MKKCSCSYTMLQLARALRDSYCTQPCMKCEWVPHVYNVYPPATKEHKDNYRRQIRREIWEKNGWGDPPPWKGKA